LAAIGKKAIPQLDELLHSKSPLIARQHAVWTLAAIDDPQALSLLRAALRHADSEIIIPTARALADRHDHESAPALAKLLEHRSSAARLAAAEALARCGTPESLAMLWEALSRDSDAFLEHAIVHAIHHLADGAELESRLNDSHPRVARAAMRLLDQPPRAPGLLKPDVVFRGVQSNDAALRRTAMELLARHPEWADRACDLLRGWIDQTDISDEQRTGLRGLVLAFQNQPTVQELAAAAIINRDGKTPGAQRSHLLAVLAESTLGELPQSWTMAVASALDDADRDVRLSAVRTAAVLQLAALDERIIKLADSEDESADIRREALRAVIRRQPKLSPAAFTFLASELRGAEQPIQRFAAAEILRDSHLAPGQLRLVLRIAEHDALVAPAVLLPAIKRSVTRETNPLVLDYLASSLRRGWRPSDAELNNALAVVTEGDANKIESIRELHRQNIQGQQAHLASFERFLSGGNAERGRQMFYSKKATCSACHRIGSEGGQVGPDLTKLGTIRSGRDLLESIVLPSATIAQGYDAYAVTTEDGRAATGVIARQTSDILVLRDSSGAELRLPKNQIEDLQRASTSIMPEGLAAALTGDELRDLLAFLKALK